MRVLGLALYGPLAASTRHRLLQYEEGLSEFGITLETHYLLSDRYLEKRFKNKNLPYWDMLRSCINRLLLLTRQKRYDCAIVYCELFPFLPVRLEKSLLKIPYVYDLDDAFFLKYEHYDGTVISALLKNKIDMLISNADAVTAGNDYLADYASRLNSTTARLPTVIDEKRYLQARRRASEIFTVGWVGSPSTSAYLEQVFDALSILGRESPVQFIIVGADRVSIPDVSVISLPWSEATEIDIICSFDVGIMPLPDSGWAKGKCAFKLIQYMACGVPAIASPVGANPAVLSGDCGLLATSTDEWVAALKAIRDNRETRQTLSRNARVRAFSTYTLSTNLPKLADILLSLPRVREGCDSDRRAGLNESSEAELTTSEHGK